MDDKVETITGIDQDVKDNRPLLSTVVLNWNRAHLLQRTLSSYLTTVSVPYELIIVDNGSSDHSRSIIEGVRQDGETHRAVFLSQNLGGEAINHGMALTHGEYLHISENDVEYMPGWDRELLRKFDAFPSLGQLSLFGPDPQSQEGQIWEYHLSRPITQASQTVFETESNVGTSCIMRRALWERGLRWTSLPTEPGSAFRFPDDGAMSALVRHAGYSVAWNDRYVVTNWGHNVDEWQAHLDYYVLNYRAKPWISESGMRRRLMEHGYVLSEETEERAITKTEPD